MAGKASAVQAVKYNNGDHLQDAIFFDGSYGDNLTLTVLNAQTGTWTVVDDVPLRAPKDYDDEGGGKTYC